jgi:putative transposase
MPWKETSVLNERKNFIDEFLASSEDFKELCSKYGISEKTGHKWKARFLEYGYHGLADQSRAPQSSPQQLDEDTVIRLIKIRSAHPRWGPKKIVVLYQQAFPEHPAPSESSVYRVLGKAGLIKKRRIRNIDNSAALMRNRLPGNEPNDVWTVDFKGWWYSTRERILPLTVRDLASRYILAIRLLENGTAQAVKAVFVDLFRTYGLPKAIRSDNGIPFATTTGFLGLTTLSAWWMYLGIIPDRIDPGCPTQNGSHERMHADLSQDIQGKKIGGVAENQLAINLWTNEYNKIRPHEALGMRTPSEVYRKSERSYAEPEEEPEYPFGFLCRIVNKDGCIRLRQTKYMLSTALRGLEVGVQQTEEHEYMIWLGDFPIGKLDTQLACITPLGILK